MTNAFDNVTSNIINGKTTKEVEEIAGKNIRFQDTNMPTTEKETSDGSSWMEVIEEGIRNSEISVSKIQESENSVEPLPNKQV